MTNKLATLRHAHTRTQKHFSAMSASKSRISQLICMCEQCRRPVVVWNHGKWAVEERRARWNDTGEHRITRNRPRAAENDSYSTICGFTSNCVQNAR